MIDVFCNTNLLSNLCRRSFSLNLLQPSGISLKKVVSSRPTETSQIPVASQTIETTSQTSNNSVQIFSSWIQSAGRETNTPTYTDMTLTICNLSLNLQWRIENDNGFEKLKRTDQWPAGNNAVSVTTIVAKTTSASATVSWNMEHLRRDRLKKLENPMIGFHTELLNIV